MTPRVFNSHIPRLQGTGVELVIHTSGSFSRIATVETNSGSPRAIDSGFRSSIPSYSGTPPPLVSRTSHNSPNPACHAMVGNAPRTQNSESIKFPLISPENVGSGLSLAHSRKSNARRNWADRKQFQHTTNVQKKLKFFAESDSAAREEFSMVKANLQRMERERANRPPKPTGDVARLTKLLSKAREEAQTLKEKLEDSEMASNQEVLKMKKELAEQRKNMALAKKDAVLQKNANLQERRRLENEITRHEVSARALKRTIDAQRRRIDELEAKVRRSIQTREEYEDYETASYLKEELNLIMIKESSLREENQLLKELLKEAEVLADSRQRSLQESREREAMLQKEIECLRKTLTQLEDANKLQFATAEAHRKIGREREAALRHEIAILKRINCESAARTQAVSVPEEASEESSEESSGGATDESSETTSSGSSDSESTAESTGESTAECTGNAQACGSASKQGEAAIQSYPESPKAESASPGGPSSPRQTVGVGTNNNPGQKQILQEGEPQMEMEMELAKQSPEGTVSNSTQTPKQDTKNEPDPHQSPEEAELRKEIELMKRMNARCESFNFINEASQTCDKYLKSKMAKSGQSDNDCLDEIKSIQGQREKDCEAEQELRLKISGLKKRLDTLYVNGYGDSDDCDGLLDDEEERRSLQNLHNVVNLARKCLNQKEDSSRCASPARSVDSTVSCSASASTETEISGQSNEKIPTTVDVASLRERIQLSSQRLVDANARLKGLVQASDDYYQENVRIRQKCTSVIECFEATSHPMVESVDSCEVIMCDAGEVEVSQRKCAYV